MRRVLSSILLFLVALWAGLAAQTLAQETETPDEERSFLVRFVERQLSSENRIIRLEGIEGALSSNARIAEITVSDREGPWLRISGASMIWSRLALLRGRLDIDELTATHIEVIRGPVPAVGPPAPEASEFSLPELPVDIQIDALSVPRLTLGEPVIDLAAELSVNGNLALAGGALDTALTIARLDGPGGQLELDAAFANETRVLELDLVLDEPADGIVANALQIEGRPDIELVLRGSGPVDNLDVTLGLDVAGEQALQGEARLRRQNEGLAVDMSANGRLGLLVAPTYADFFGAETVLAARALVKEAGGVRLDEFSIQGGDIDVSGQLETASDNFLERLMVDAVIGDPDNTAAPPVLLPVAGAETRIGSIRLAARFDAASGDGFSVNFDLDRWQGAQSTADSITLVAEGTLVGVSTPADRRLTFTTSAQVNGFASRDPALSNALGSQIDLDARGAWQSGAPLVLETASLSARGLDAEVEGEISPRDFDGRMMLSAADIAAFSDLAGRSLGGSLDLSARGQIAFLGGAFNLQLDGAGRDLSVGSDQLDPLLASPVRLSGGLSRGTDGVKADDFVIANEQVSMRVTGGYAPAVADLSVTASLSDLALVSERASGATDLRIAVNGDEDLMQVDVVVAMASGTMAGRSLEDVEISFAGRLLGIDPVAGTPYGNGIAGDLSGRALLEEDRADLSASVAYSPDVRRLEDLVFRMQGAEITGEIVQAVDGLFDGRLIIDASDVAPTAALAGLEASGSARASLLLRSADAEQFAELKADINGLGVHTIRLERGQLDAQISDLFGIPMIAGDLNAEGIAAGGLAIASLRGQARSDGAATRFTLDADLENETVMSLGGHLEEREAGFLVALERVRLAQGEVEARLVEPASLRIDGSDIEIEPAVFDIAGGTLRIEGTGSDNALDMAMAIEALPLSIANLVQPQLALAGTLNGQVSVFGSPNDPQADYTLSADGVDTALLADFAVAPLSATVSGGYQDGAIDIAQLSLTGQSDVTINGSGTVPLTGDGLSVRTEGRAPLELINPLLAERVARASGLVEFSLNVSGSLAQPKIDGVVSTSAAEFIDPETNIRLTDIRVLMEVRNDTVSLSTLSANVAGGGTITAGGTIGIAPGSDFPVDLSIRLNDAHYTDQELIAMRLSGDVAVTGQLLRDPLVSGVINIERAEFTIPEKFTSAAQVAEVKHVEPLPEVKVTLQRARVLPPDDAMPTPTARPIIVRLDMTINAPQSIFVRGLGIDAELGGTVRLSGPVTQIAASGGFELVRGRLVILNRRINFTKGSVQLLGDFDPVIDLIATSEASDATIMIEVRGPVSDIDIDLSSSPALPDDEIMTRLIFGRPVSELSPFQIAQIATSLSQLRGGAAGRRDLRSSTGLDELDVVSDQEGRSAVRAGKAINDNLRLGVQAGSQDTSEVTIDYDVNSNFKVRGATGADRSSIGIFFERDY